MSEEALLNETTRVLGRIPSGGQNAEEIPEKSISDIIYDLIKTKIGLESSKPLFREPTKFKKEKQEILLIVVQMQVKQKKQ